MAGELINPAGPRLAGLKPLLLLVGVAAAIATVHDILAVLGIFYFMHKEINLLIVTALLTLGGYSLTDTVVVFDRIRENLKKNKRDPLPKLVNDSINEVLSRTIITSLTVVLVLVPLVLFASPHAAAHIGSAIAAPRQRHLTPCPACPRRRTGWRRR